MSSQVIFQPGFDWDVRPEATVLPLIAHDQLRSRLEQIRADWMRAVEEADADPRAVVIDLVDFFDCLFDDLTADRAEDEPRTADRS